MTSGSSWTPNLVVNIKSFAIFSERNVDDHILTRGYNWLCHLYQPMQKSGGTSRPPDIENPLFHNL